LPSLLEALLTDRTDVSTWRALAALARALHGDAADDVLAGMLGVALRRLGPERRGAVIDAVGAILGAAATSRLVATLASDGELAARHLALVTLGRMPVPLDALLFQPLRGLLLDRRLPVEAQFDALGGLIRTAGPASPLTGEFLELLVSGLGKARSIDRLRQFEQRFGSLPALDSLCAGLEEQLRMSCPRCGVELRRPEMVKHLWDEHGLVLDGRRVRDPWAVIDDWIDAFKERGETEMLERCRTAAQRLDPEQGPSRVNRLLLQRGVEGAEARRDLLAEAKGQHAALCPACFGLVPVPQEVPPLRLIRRGGRLAAGGYGVEVRETGLQTSLDVWTPERLIYRGPAPGRRWAPKGAMLLLVSPFVLLALVFAFGVLPGVQPVIPVAILLAGAFATHLLLHLVWQMRVPLSAHVLEYAWTMLVPRLHAKGFARADSAFLAGLALVTRSGASRLTREDLLPDLLKRTERAVAARDAPPSHLAALSRLTVEDAAARGADPVPLVAEQLARCFQGRLSLAFAERLLDDWQTEWWTPGNLARLRILLCDRAFEAGFEVRNLLDAGLTAPSLGVVLDTDDAQGLAALRLLWSLRPTRPWDRCGEVTTVFDLAADPARAELLGEHPDLLLWQEERAWVLVGDGGEGAMGPARILLCTRGVQLQETLFTDVPRVVEVLTKSLGYELALGKYRFRSHDDLDLLARRMERWFRYWFSEFLPAMKAARTWQAPDRAAILRAWGVIACPECGHDLVARPGEVAISLEEAGTGK
jgi:hypothetical protein